MYPCTSHLRLATLSLSLAFAVTAPAIHPVRLLAQAPAAAVPRAAPQRGTVKSIDGSTLTLTTDTGQQLVVNVAAAARVQRLAPGSTDLKTAEAAQISDVAVGDRILVTGTAGDSPTTFNAARVILMKSSDIAQRREAEQTDWQKRGAGGIITAIDPAAGAITVTSGPRKLGIATDAKTIYRRYADGSVKFEDAKPGTLAQLNTGDQILARGAKSDDGTSIHAEEIVSGSFKNLSGTIVSIDAAKNTVSLKDLVSKRTVVVQLTPNSALHRLPPEAAARLAARAHAAGAASGTAPAASGTPPAASGTPPTAPASRPTDDAPAGDRPAGGGHGGGGDLSQVVARLPAVPLSDLHAGDAVMIVAEQSASDASNLTAVTLLAGVEPLLAAAPGGSSALTLSPWNVGGGSPEGGGSQ